MYLYLYIFFVFVSLFVSVLVSVFVSAENKSFRFLSRVVIFCTRRIWGEIAKIRWNFDNIFSGWQLSQFLGSRRTDVNVTAALKNDQKVALKKSCLKCLTQKISRLKKCKEHELKLEINNVDCSFFIYNHQARVVQISNQVNLRRKFDG